MSFTDTSEKGLEALIVDYLIHHNGYVSGENTGYDRDHAIDLKQLTAFLDSTQPKLAESLCLQDDSPQKVQFLHRLQGEIAKRGVIDVIRNGVKHGPYNIEMYYTKPSAGNIKAQQLHAANIFSVTRQLRYSKDETQLSLDFCIFLNGLPLATFELKNRLTKQTVADAVQQYKRDRNPKDLLFHFGRCIVHFAVDDQEVKMCTHLKGKDSWFLPFNKGYNDGAGNPPNESGIKTDYLWKQILTKQELTGIIENYAQITEEKDDKGRKKFKQVFPRYHQLDVVKKLLADTKHTGAGKRYLIQHSAGSGKSNSIAWLSHQLVGLEKDGKAQFDSVIVVTDRRVLDKQIRNTVKQFAQVSATVGHAEHSGDLKQFIRGGKRIIISTIQKFPYILDEIGSEHQGRKFAIIIDEAHSSQGGKASGKMNIVLSGEVTDESEETYEDIINSIMEARKMLTNASYFAFTATPKNKTLEIFGEPVRVGDIVKHRPFHSYTMKQAIQEGFILDVLSKYTPIESYYHLMKTIEEDPLFDSKKAQKKLRRYVETHDYAISEKAEIMVNHFHESIIARRKIGGSARAMVVCNGIALAIKYYHAITTALLKRKSPYRAVVAFSGEHRDGSQTVNEAALNEFPSNMIEKKIQQDPYRFLVVADKFQTGYDEPLLHTMYVDKTLSGIKAVQTLSRLNRAHPQKTDTFVLDFKNDADTIIYAFSDYYRTTILSQETDPNKLHDLKGTLDNYQVYTQSQVLQLVTMFINGADRDMLDPILDSCVAVYQSELDEDGQVEFKSKSKAFVRTYEFLASIIPYTNRSWEELCIFLNFLIPKLPSPIEEGLSKGLIETIDMDSYRNEVRETMQLTLPDEDSEIDPIPSEGGKRVADPEAILLSDIIKLFNEQFGNIDWKDADRIGKAISEEIPQKVAADKAYQNAMKNSDKAAARLEHDRALQTVIISMLSDHTELFKQFSDNPGFKKWLSDSIFGVTYQEKGTYEQE